MASKEICRIGLSYVMKFLQNPTQQVMQKVDATDAIKQRSNLRCANRLTIIFE